MTAPLTRFVLPAEREATAPPERRGLTRDGVRLLVAGPDGVEHRRFADLGEYLDPGDLLVVNTSATLPAALDARRAGGEPTTVHVSTTLDDGTWVVEPRRPDGPDRGVTAGEVLTLTDDVRLALTEPYPDPTTTLTRLWRAHTDPPREAAPFLRGHGRPIGYGYLAGAYPLGDHQTVYATEPGSAEMASAGRPFTERLLVRLMAGGVVVAPIVLHCGVSSPEKHEPPMPERYTVPAATARLVTGTRDAGGRVVAVGTTVVRALESAADPDGTVRPAGGWTDLVLGPDRPARVVDTLISGLHAPEASHLLLLEAVVGPEVVGRAYAAAVEHGDYLWHEFGDSTLLGGLRPREHTRSV
ncbi:S-adenosylmethionine:tRNA ribosyltransferase-isomerase [Actinomycetospora sp. TBRC 11914]|uniref:S-adenosylmethionine:tRNA ribosyltransferase-isomerase n=1 Tax=Actinomycetospora sp. TBRC 11914 TaxID=2729387 RepID=UPI00145DF736|nr:S-adenosylmethionine:tRNA ribosyltransferase-isomerase [Actinomycetospora sp. TBRC 11914]NMO91516.1 S-adenosylmethionine:tRNA ribosyltransferase-isomerase [Actinomycetospora sp. TBRC 11914]